MSQINLAEKVQQCELSIYEYWVDCYEKDDVDEEGVPYADSLIFVSSSPLSKQGIEVLLRSQNPDYKLLAWGERNPEFDEF